MISTLFLVYSKKYSMLTVSSLFHDTISKIIEKYCLKISFLLQKVKHSLTTQNIRDILQSTHNLVLFSYFHKVFLA